MLLGLATHAILFKRGGIPPLSFFKLKEKRITQSLNTTKYQMKKTIQQ